MSLGRGAKRGLAARGTLAAYDAFKAGIETLLRIESGAVYGQTEHFHPGRSARQTTP